jgi:transcription elongation factor GreA
MATCPRTRNITRPRSARAGSRAAWPSIDVSRMSGEQVKFGATVTVVDEDTEAEATYKIVGDDEADVKSGKISLSSPIARSMINKEVGDVVEVTAPGGIKTYEIMKVEWL